MVSGVFDYQHTVRHCVCRGLLHSLMFQLIVFLQDWYTFPMNFYDPLLPYGHKHGNHDMHNSVIQHARALGHEVGFLCDFNFVNVLIFALS